MKRKKKQNNKSQQIAKYLEETPYNKSEYEMIANVYAKVKFGDHDQIPFFAAVVDTSNVDEIHRRTDKLLEYLVGISKNKAKCDKLIRDIVEGQEWSPVPGVRINYVSEYWHHQLYHMVKGGLITQKEMDAAISANKYHQDEVSSESLEQLREFDENAFGADDPKPDSSDVCHPSEQERENLRNIARSCRQ